MEIKINDNKQFNVQINGRLDTNTAPELEDILMEQYINPKCKKNIIFDCSGLEYLSSAGLRVIVMLLKYAERNHISVNFANMKDAIYEIFQVTGFADLLNMRK